MKRIIAMILLVAGFISAPQVHAEADVNNACLTLAELARFITVDRDNGIPEEKEARDLINVPGLNNTAIRLLLEVVQQTYEHPELSASTMKRVTYRSCLSAYTGT